MSPPRVFIAPTRTAPYVILPARVRRAFEAGFHLGSFTDRERVILEGLAHGFSNREIAEATGMAVHTIEWYKHALKRLTGVRSSLELCIFAVILFLLEAFYANPESPSSSA